MSFAEAVAQRSGRDEALVEAALAGQGIEPQPAAAAPVPLQVTRLKFTGVKRRQGREDQPFEFERNLGRGLWAITSETANLAGKSSVLFIIRWALTGRSHLTQDVHDWISSVELDGVVGDESFAVRFTQEVRHLAGELRTGDTVVAEFDGSNFEEVMDGYFLDRLRLDPTPFWQSRGRGSADEGDRRRFGWSSYFPALHLRAENTAHLLGDQHQGGQPGALMQVFLGLPWALTAATARVARNELRMRRSAKNRRQAEDARAREVLLVPVREELAKTQQALATLMATRAAVAPAEADLRLTAYSEALKEQRDAENRLVASRFALSLSQEDLDEALKRLEALEQSRVVVPLLGRLTPTVCPRCSTAISQDKVQREHAEHECSVCAERLGAEEEDEQAFEMAREAVRRATEERETAERELREAEEQHAAAAALLADAEAAVREFEERRPAEAETRELETTIARLEGRLEQSVVVTVPEGDDLDVIYEIVEAALQEADARRSAAATGLLEELGRRIVELGKAFGIENLEGARPDLAAHLRLRIGQAEASFSSRTGGERLRLRLATVIALLRIGNEAGVGRHPGLLLIDSPGGEEMVDEDVAAILRELTAVPEQMPELQLIVATARASEVRGIVPDGRIIRGPDYGEVW
jgi:hypothetical protein